MRTLIRDRRAVTALEYGMIAALIAVVILGALKTIGTESALGFGKIGAAVQAANTPAK